jgi:hypothetical protein
VGNNQGQEVERETEECRLGGGVSRSGNIEYICMHHHDESKKGFVTGRENLRKDWQSRLVQRKRRNDRGRHRARVARAWHWRLRQ